MKLCFDDNGLHKRLAPLTLTRPVCDIRFGIRTNRESWCDALGSTESFFKTEDYLNVRYHAPEEDMLCIAGNVKPTPEIISWVKDLDSNDQLIVNGVWIASGSSNASNKIEKESESLLYYDQPWHLFQLLDQAIESDYEQLTAGKTSAPISSTNQVLGNRVFFEEGAKAECCILNSETGPIYIGKNAELLEGSMIRGAFALCEGAVVKMGAKIYGATAIGPFCKVGGELSNCMFQAHSNKGHDGFLGNSLVGEWCNFGADSNTSNLKNNYSNVSFYSYDSEQLEKTDVLFMGVIMGDHSKTGINTMLNTATSVGVSANVFDGGFPPKYIPSFAWGGKSDDQFILDKAFEVARNMMKRRKVEFEAADEQILRSIYNTVAR